ncbi:EamA family transporter [Paenalcaligenes sp. Me131]|uniref:EamA family transporter n=1 Tax=Paenalcaligenes sp. Me131 TaxID=3392636 RepID=UPI003D2D50F7
MHLLLISIACSVGVSILFKLARRYQLDIGQAVVINYLTAITLCVLLLRPDPMSVLAGNTSFWVLGSLGVLLPSVFLIMGKAVEQAGIVRSDAAQRLSLLIPLLAAVFIFGESVTGYKGYGIALALVALLCLLSRSKASTTASTSPQHTSQHGTLWLLIVWLGYGVIDILFKQLSKAGAQFAGSLVVSFAIAGVVMLTWLLLQRTRWSRRSLLSGILLGVLNFSNIYFYIRAHQHYAENPTLVFSAMNIGVISLGTLIGAGFFREKLSWLNIVGIILAVASILLLFPR